MPGHAPVDLPTFVEDYRRIRLAEGYASVDPEFARRLPFRDTTGRNAGTWRIRAFHYLVLRAVLAASPGVRRVLDVGAGNGWLARRLAGRYEVTAVDVDGGETGLGGLRDPRVVRLRGDLEALPVAAGRFDAVIAAAAIHYAVDLDGALAELGRVLRPGGFLVIVDSPLYRDSAARQSAWERTRAHYEAAGAPRLADRYRGLTRAELAGASQFRFVTLSPGIPSLRAALAGLLGGGRNPGVRLPLLYGRKW
jgi:SAM-dependent methyltransferase